MVNSDSKNSLDEIKVTRKSGNERFQVNEEPLDEFTLLNFWQWSCSDLTNNTQRGVLAEYIVACDLGITDSTRTEWDSYDLVTEEGIKVEVKSAAYLQSWWQSDLSKIMFGISPTCAWDYATNTRADVKKRQAEVYVFCILKHKDKSTVNPLNLDQWEFYILPTAVLNEKRVGQQKITLSSLLKLKPSKVKFGGINECIKRLYHNKGLIDYPNSLTPRTVETFNLPSGSTIDILKTTPLFQLWKGEPIEDTYGNKSILNYRDEPVFAELAILRSFQYEGWEGVWVDTFHKKYRIGYWGENDFIHLPDRQRELLTKIYKRAGLESGCWDVFCWKGDQVMFIESKRKSKDKIRNTQLVWLEAAIQTPLPLESFLVVEWDLL